MLFQKLFRVLVVSGTMMGAAGCAANASSSSAPKSSDAGTAAKPPDAGTKQAEPASGPPGW